jgi:hypothetical protein
MGSAEDPWEIKAVKTNNAESCIHTVSIAQEAMEQLNKLKSEMFVNDQCGYL